MRLTYDDILKLDHLTGREIVLPVDPVAKPRMTRRDKWLTGADKRPCVARYHAFKDALRAAWPSGVDFPTESVIVQFNIPMPKSWSNAKKDRMRGERHEQRPDVDNMLKACLDAQLVEDKEISTVMAEKRWADEGSIRIVVYPDENNRREAA